MLEPSKNSLAWIDDLTGGLNVTAAPQKIDDDQLQLAQNIEWTQTRVAQRRQGGQNNIGTEVWGASKSLVSLWCHTPSNNETAAELLAMDNSATVVLGRLAASANWSAITVVDAISNASQAEIISFNSKAFVAYDSAVDRLHVWDGTSLRRAGIATPAAPTATNTGSGTYAAVQRWYKVQWERQVGANFQRSELSPALAFTPSGSGTAARVTRPTAPGEGETAWVLFGSPDNVNFYRIGSAVLATTTIDDSTAPSAYATTTSFPGFPTAADYYTAPPSAKYLLVDGARLLLFSSWETAAYTSRMWFTPLLGTTATNFSVSDEERVPSTNFLDLDPTDGGGLTGAAMYNGSPYAFKLARVYKLNATANAAKPYTRTRVNSKIGALSHRSIVSAEDDAGNECLYFLSRRGPYRLSDVGLEFLGHDIEFGLWSTVNKASTTLPFGVYYEQKHQIWWWLTTGSNTNPDTVLVLSIPHARRLDDGTVRGGWTTFTGDIAVALAAVMFSKTLAATMSLDLKPYVAQVNNGASDPDGPLVTYDTDGIYTDGGARATSYTATFRTKAFAPGGRDKRGGLLEGFLVAKATGAALTINVIRDYGIETVPAAVAISGDPQVTRDDTKIENLTVGDCETIELQFDDGGAPRAWTIDSIGLRLKEEGQR
jgi:hypothetical protein